MWRRRIAGGALAVLLLFVPTGGTLAAGRPLASVLPSTAAGLLPAGLAGGDQAVVAALLALATEASGQSQAQQVGQAVLPSVVRGPAPGPALAALPWAIEDVAAAQAVGLVPAAPRLQLRDPVTAATWSAMLQRALGSATAGGALANLPGGAVSRGWAVQRLLAAFGLGAAAQALDGSALPSAKASALSPVEQGALALAVRLDLLRGLGAAGLGATAPLTQAQGAVLLVRTLLLKRMAETALSLLSALRATASGSQASPPPGLAALELLVRNTPQLATLRAWLPPPQDVRRTVAPTPGDAGESGVLYLPDGASPAPGVVFVNGVVSGGWADPQVATAARSLAELGLAVYVPNLPGLRREQLTPRMLPALEKDVRWLAASPAVRPGGVALFGVSVGASLALVAAARPRLAGLLRGVVAVAPYARVRDLLRAATTGVGPGLRGAAAPFRPDAWTRWVLARSVAGTVPDAASRAVLLGRLGPVPSTDPLAPFLSAPPTGLSPAAQAWWRLWGNRWPSRFAPLYAALPPDVRATLRSLSPAGAIGDVTVSVVLAAPLQDTAFPPAESVILARLAPSDVTLFRTSSLEHAYPRLGDSLVGEWRFYQFALRALGLLR